MYRPALPNRMLIPLVVVVLVLTFAGLAAWQFVTIKSTGTPLGPAMRASDYIVQIISTQERYLPSLHRNPSKDRYRLDLLIVSTADPARQEMITLIRQQQSNALQPMTKILGAQGDVVWVQALDLFAVNLRTKRVAGEADLRKANPELGRFLHSAKPQFTDRLLAVAPDWSSAYEFSGETLKATACPPPSRGSWLEEQLNGRIAGSLSSGGLIAATEWIAVATPEDAKSDFKPGFSLPRDFTAGEKDRNRQLYRGTADTSKVRPPIQSSQRISETEYRQATLLRAEPGGTLLRATNPDSVFLLSRTGKELFAPFTLTRLAPDGNAIWNSATGIARLAQVLPGADCIALIGERPPVPNKVPEPILVLVNPATGATNTVSLWR